MRASTNLPQSPAFKVLEGPERTDMWGVWCASNFRSHKSQQTFSCMLLSPSNSTVVSFSVIQISRQSLIIKQFFTHIFTGNICMHHLAMTYNQRLKTWLFKVIRNRKSLLTTLSHLLHTHKHQHTNRKHWQKVCAEKLTGFYFRVSRWALSWRHQVSYYLA